MAKIPEYQRRDIFPTGDVPTQQVSPQVVSTSGRNIEVISQGIGEVSDMFQRARSLAEETKAHNVLDSNIAKHIESAQRDPDFSETNRKKYHEEITNSIKDSAMSISIPAEKNLFLDKAMSKSAMSKIDVDNIFFKKSMDSAKADFAIYEENQKELYINTDNPKMRERAILDIESLEQQKVAAGFITREQAAEDKIKRDKKWNEDFIDNKIQQDPYRALAELQKGEQGFYKGIPDTLRTDKIDKARTASIKAEKEQAYYLEIATNKNEAALMDKYFSGQLKEQAVKDAQERGEISPKFAMSMIKSLESPKVIKGKKDAKVYMDLVDEIQSKNYNPSDLREKILNTVGKGITASQAEYLYSVHNIPMGEKKTSLADLVATQKTVFAQDEQEKKNFQIRSENINTGIDMIKSVFKMAGTTIGANVIADVIENFYERIAKENVSSDKIPQIAKEELDKHAIKTNPNRSKYKIGDIVPNDKTGKSAIVTGYDDDGEPTCDEIK